MSLELVINDFTSLSGDHKCEHEDANDAEMVQVLEELGRLKID
jgi:hypothetical protein